MGSSGSRKVVKVKKVKTSEQGDVSEEAITQKKLYKYYSRYSNYKRQEYSWPMKIFEGKHSDSIKGCCYSPDGNYLATVSDDKTVKIWNIKKQREEFTLNGHSDPVNCCSYSPDGNYLATGSGSFKFGEIKFWNIKERREEFTLKGHLRSVKCCSYSPDGNYMATGSNDKTIKIWNIKERREDFTLNGCSNLINCCSYSPDGNYLATGSSTIKIWNIKEQREEFTLDGHLDWVKCCSYSPDGNYLATGSDDKLVKIWNIKEQREEFTFNGHLGWVKCCSYSPDGNYLAIGSADIKVKIWNIREKRQEFTLNTHSNSVNCCSYSPDGNFLAIGLGSYKSGEIKIWNIQEQREELSLKGYTDWVDSSSYSPDGNYLVTGLNYKKVRIWNIKNHRKESTIKGYSDRINCCSYSPDGNYLAIGSGNYSAGEIKFWNIKEKKEEFSLNGRSGSVYCCSFSPDGNYLATGSSDNKVKIWNIREKRQEFILNGHSDWVKCCSYSPDGNYLATGSVDKTVIIWNLNEQREEFTLNGHSDWINLCSYTHDGNYLITGSKDKTVKIWNIKERKEVSNLKNYYEPEFFNYFRTWINLSNNNIAMPVYSKDGLFEIKIKDGSRIICCFRSYANEEFHLYYDTSNLIGLFFIENDKYLLAVYEYGIFKISFWNKLLYILHNSLSRCIIKRKNLKLLYKDAKVERFICDYYEEYNQNQLKIEEQLSIIVSKLLQQFDRNKTIEDAMDLSNYIVKFAKFNYNLSLDNNASRILSKYFFKAQDKGIDVEGKYDIQILIFLSDSIIEFDNKEKIELLLKQLIELREFHNRKIDAIKPLNIFDMKKFITLEELSEKYLFKTIKNEYYSIELFKSLYKSRKVLVKKYIIDKNLSKELIKTIELEFEKEAMCLELLDNHRNNDYCFGEYLGSIKLKKSFSLVVTDSKMTLSEFLSRMEVQKSEGKDIYSSAQIKIIIKSLVRSFAFLEQYNILHRFINPHAFLIDENYNIEIIEFIHAAIKINNIWKESDNLFSPKVVNDYRSPEENTKNKKEDIDLEKCDIYSLGLVILQLIHLKNIDYVKNNIESLIDDLNKFNLLWLQEMLQKMLCIQPENRLKFNQLNEYIENNITESISNII